jgi:hypothetical protein
MRYVICLVALVCAFPVRSADVEDQTAAVRDSVIQGKSVCLDQEPQETSQGSSYDPALQTNLWVSHLTRFASVHSEMTDEQRSIVLQGRDLLAGGLLLRLHSSDVREAATARGVLAAFKTRASDSFSREAYAEVFVRLRQPSSSSRLRPPSSAIPTVPYCDCNSYTGECGGGACVTGSCRAMPEGCGTFGTDACFGLCW